MNDLFNSFTGLADFPLFWYVYTWDLKKKPTKIGTLKWGRCQKIISKKDYDSRPFRWIV